MEIRQATFFSAPDESQLGPLAEIDPHLLLVFGAAARVTDPALPAVLARVFPLAHYAGCSSSGDISSQGVTDDSLVITALRFKSPMFRVASENVEGMTDSSAAGARVAASLIGDGLRAVMLLGPGVNINGSALIEGVSRVLGDAVPLYGGLAGDGGQFVQSWTLCDGVVSEHSVVGIGFYGDGFRFAHGSFGGWQPFGVLRRVTRSAANVLFELDGKPALDIYKHYLGDHARDLPASGLLFPFAMAGAGDSNTELIRTILGVNEDDGSLTLAGDIVEGGYLRLMAASTDALVSGAETAAESAQKMFGDRAPGLALMVSCVGRKLMMAGRTEEEVEAVAQVFGSGTVLAGFYSNGEISPHGASSICQLHNQTMTIACLAD